MPIDVRRILFPTDFSTPARYAQQYAVALAEQFGAELHVLHVISPLSAQYPDTTAIWALPPIDAEVDTWAARESLAAELAEVVKTNIVAVQAVSIGFAIDEILKYVKRHAIDIVVIGTHGRTSLARLLLGSVAEKLVRTCDCPVLTVHPSGHQFVIDAKRKAAYDE